MTILEKIAENAQKHPRRPAYYYEKPAGGGYKGDGEIPCHKARSISWGDLDEQSGRLAYYLDKSLGTRTPVVVYGHKDPLMLVCFLACVKSGRAYCPIDVSVPSKRVDAVIREVQPEVILATEELSLSYQQILFAEDIRKIIETAAGAAARERAVAAQDVFYIIFTSGSTGVPKGVQITRDCLDHFIEWGLTLGSLLETEEGEGCVFLNQAPFSFDLSVMDLYLSLYSGGTIWALDRKIQGNMRELLASLKRSRAAVWVSTPSFAEVCLSDPSFGEAVLPDLRTFLFCGETLANRTAQRLLEAFPRAVVVNTYGPTESTVAVTGVTVTRELAGEVNPLPVGKARKGTWIFIMDEEGNLLPEGESGEIVIAGDTVSAGYWNAPERTGQSFGSMEIGGRAYRFYRTGDRGYQKGEQLFYCGRMDLQIKLHGYRMELEDIEQNIMKLPGIRRAAVLPVRRGGQVRSLSAFVAAEEMPKDAFAESQRLREALRRFLPDYMIPKKFVFLESLPLTVNGKVDRRVLGGDIL